jgi:hypothetical protein
VVYASDPDAAPDADFAPGTLADLVPGNRGRLLDPRRTPVTVVGLALATGLFSVRVDAFEDAGAVWEVPFEDAGRFQFAHGGARTDPAPLAAIAARLDRPLEIPAASPAAALARLTEEREAAREFVAPVDPAPYAERRLGEPALYAALAAFLDTRGAGEMERAFAERYVSNPWSGELVKGHAIVLAELGLVPFRGKVVRDPELLAGAWSRERRAAHLLARLAFVQELLAAPIAVYRGVRAPGPGASLVSASFSRAVAAENGRVTRWDVPPERVLMTFLETEAMNRHYREAEAVLLADWPA